jgi:hypothetical protein
LPVSSLEKSGKDILLDYIDNSWEGSMKVYAIGDCTFACEAKEMDIFGAPLEKTMEKDIPRLDGQGGAG